MRAAEAQTAVLYPAGPPPMADPPPVVAVTPVSPPTPAPAGPVMRPEPVEGPSTSSGRILIPTPAEPIAAYLIGMDATPLLRSSLADFLDAAGTRRDVRASVGVATGHQVSWVLRDRVPYGVRAMPGYPEGGRPPDTSAALTAAAAVVAADAADAPARRQLVVLLWDRPPEVVALPPTLASALVLHCADAVLALSAANGAGGATWVLARSRPGPRPSLLAQAGRLLDDWESFAALPPGLGLGRLP